MSLVQRCDTCNPTTEVREVLEQHIGPITGCSAGCVDGWLGSDTLFEALDAVVNAPRVTVEAYCDAVVRLIGGDG
jgi:hypothetical protein